MNDLGVREQFAYDTALLSDLVDFITHHRNNRKALTAKLYVATYLAENYLWTETTRMIGHVVWEEAMTLFESIQSEFPDSWQGKAASLYIALHNLSAIKEEKEVRIARYRQLFPLARDLEQYGEFKEFDSCLNRRRDYSQIGAVLHSYIIEQELWQWWSDRDEAALARAEAELARMEQAYPDVPLTRDRKTQIALERAKQPRIAFDGNLTGLPEVRLLKLLRSSDPDKARQAAAAFGNYPPAAFSEIIKAEIYKEILSYLDRALSGDAAERDAMIDLIYRLWQLAVPALLDTLDHTDPERVAFAGERLL